MALQSSGNISLLDIQNEFGGSNPIGMDEYYFAAEGVPVSGEISFQDFYGKSSFDYGFITPITTWVTYDTSYTYCWYRFDLSTLPTGVAKERTFIWMGALFTGDYNSGIANAVGYTGGTYLPSSFITRINYRSSAYSEGFYHNIIEIKVPAGQQYVDFYTRNTTYVTNTAGTYDPPNYVYSPNTSRLVSPGGHVFTGTLTNTTNTTNGFSGNPSVTVPASSTGRVVFAVAVRDWGSNCPITPYTTRWVYSYMGFAIKVDQTSVVEEVFSTTTSDPSSISVSSYTIG